MAELMTLKVEGFKELEKKLLAMGPKLARNGLRAAVGAGARVIRDEARSRVPVDTGVLRRSIYVKQIRELSSNSQQTFFVGVRSGKKYRRKGQDAYYWRWVEFGHRIVARFAGEYTDYKLKGLGRLTGISKRRKQSKTTVPAQPFMRPAFESGKYAATEAIKAKLIERVEAYAKENT
jgi:HK97 gp10 family phage protein